MRRVWLILLLVCGTCIGFAEEAPLPEGSALMQQVRAQLPPMPLRLDGFVRTRKGKVQQDRRLVTELHFGEPVPYARYTLSDNFGDLITKVQVSWPEGVPSFAQWDADGNPLPAPAPQDRVADTGLTWSDLALDFLWWPGAEVQGRDLVKTRNAIVILIPAPEETPDVDQVKLWVDERALFVVRAQFLDAKGKLLKEIEVDSIKKVREDFWMVKDLIIKDRVNKSHMGIRFEDVIEIADE